MKDDSDTRRIRVLHDPFIMIVTVVFLAVASARQVWLAVAAQLVLLGITEWAYRRLHR